MEPIVFPKMIGRDFVSAHKNILFIFGDNLMERGEGGQARACRYQPNAMGIPTKRTPCSGEDRCYMSDGLYDTYVWHIDSAIDRIIAAAPRYELVYVLPRIGEGRAELHIRAPKVFEYLINRLKQPPFNYERPRD